MLSIVEFNVCEYSQLCENLQQESTRTLTWTNTDSHQQSSSRKNTQQYTQRIHYWPYDIPPAYRVAPKQEKLSPGLEKTTGNRSKSWTGLKRGNVNAYSSCLPLPKATSSTTRATDQDHAVSTCGWFMWNFVYNQTTLHYG